MKDFTGIYVQRENGGNLKRLFRQEGDLCKMPQNWIWNWQVHPFFDPLWKWGGGWFFGGFMLSCIVSCFRDWLNKKMKIEREREREGDIW